MNWEIIDQKLVKTYQAKDFSTLIDKLSSLAVIADEKQHHPDFKVFDYNKIEFKLYTHSSKSITDQDYNLAEIIEGIFG